MSRAVDEVCRVADLHCAAIDGDRGKALILFKAEDSEELGEAEVFCHKPCRLRRQAGVSDQIPVPPVGQHTAQREANLELVQHGMADTMPVAPRAIVGEEVLGQRRVSERHSLAFKRCRQCGQPGVFEPAVQEGIMPVETGVFLLGEHLRDRSVLQVVVECRSVTISDVIVDGGAAALLPLGIVELEVDNGAERCTVELLVPESHNCRVPILVLSHVNLESHDVMGRFGRCSRDWQGDVHILVVQILADAHHGHVNLVPQPGSSL